AAWLASYMVVRHDKRVIINHDALEARIGAHVLAHRFAQKPCVAPRGKGIKRHPEPLPWAKVKMQQPHAQFADRRKIANECGPGPPRDGYPDDMLGCLEPELAQVPGLFIKPNARNPIAFNAPFDPHENLRIHRLRTRISAKQPPGNDSEQKQRKR